MRLTTKNIMKLGMYPVMDIPRQPKTYGYELTIADQKLTFQKYGKALKGLVVAVRNGHEAKIDAVRL